MLLLFMAMHRPQGGDSKCRIIERDGLKFHVCLSCNKEVVGRGDFNKHYRTHTNEKPYQCRANPQCKKRFGDASTRVRHERVHDMKRYECRHCKFLYTRKDNRDRHEIKCNGGQRKRKRGAGGNHERIGNIVWNPETVSFDEEPAGISGSNPSGEYGAVIGKPGALVYPPGSGPATDQSAATSPASPLVEAEAASEHVRLGPQIKITESPGKAPVNPVARRVADGAAAVADGDVAEAETGSPKKKKANKVGGDDDAMAILLMAASRAPRATGSTP